MKGSTFRLLMGTESVYSTKFILTRKGKGIKLTGNGWGHGIGLCQWGAKGMASRGYTYKAILRFYFPHTKVVRWHKKLKH